ncbi:uncharacterized protein [Choristoneura fumiferana]|uniref:uncharacterized protein n=1 Tax=Choristoneura fumiferana TaxID=7141 RepID=UPI003D15D9C8
MSYFSSTEDAEDEASATVWSYFEREAGARARCVVCRAVVARSDLKVHLKVNHPKLVAEVDLGSDDEASDSQEDVYTEIVYLEEEQNAKKHKSTPKPKLKSEPYIERPEPRKRQVSSSSDEVPLKRKKNKTDDKQPDNNDEIEQFGKYVTCLLKKIPAAACMELQAEIINLIMKKQLELKRNETSVLAGDKMAETAGDSKAEFESTPSTSSININNGATE